MRIAIVGAGVAGLTTAKTLRQVGHEVVVYDRTPDVGGVWSSTRRYPGVTTQSPASTYSLSDFPMPKDFPEWPTGEQVQGYFASYAKHFGLDEVLRLNTEVGSARPVENGWLLESEDLLTRRRSTETFDRLVVANGVFCEPNVPHYEGIDEFSAAGGQLCAASQFHDAEHARGRDVLVVGYGKSACDVAVEISDVANGTSVIARQLLWKVPRRIAGVLNFKMLLLTRMGESLFRYEYLRGFEKFLHGVGNPIRRNMINSIGSVSRKQYKLDKLGLVPSGSMEDIVRNAIGLVSDGFFERVGDGRITVHRDMTIERLTVVDGKPHAQLRDGTVLPADLIVCATGYKQGVAFLDDDVTAQLLDERSNFMLYRQILPVTVANLYFAGYNSSFFSPLNAEMGAVWIAAHLAGRVDVPEGDALRQAVVDRLAFMDSATGGHHCRGTKIIPFSLHNVDELLGDVGLNISARVRASHWLNPVSPAAYRKVSARLAATLGPAAQSLVPAAETFAQAEVVTPISSAHRRSRASA